MGAVVAGIGNLFKFHKLKMAAVVFFTAVFGILSFPYGDLSGILPTKIYEWTGNQAYVQFEDFGLNFVPFGLSMDQVLIEVPGRAPIEAAHIDVSPWILGALTAKTGASVDAQDLFGGLVVADYREGDKTKAGNRVANVAVDAQGLKIPALMKFARESGMGNLNLLGTMNLSTQMTIDALFGEQPAGDLEATFQGLTFPAQILKIPVAGGQLDQALPEVKIGSGKLTARMGRGTINISDFSFGSVRDSIAGKISGQVGLAIRRDAMGTRPQMENIDLTIDLTMKKALLDSDKTLQLATLMINQFGRQTPEGTRFQFRMRMAPGQAMPQFSAAQ